MPGPVDPIPTRLPHGRTARRVRWEHLPPVVRRAVESRLGAAVVDADSQDAGFTPGLASVLTDAAGERHFVKAASLRAQRSVAAAYRQEAAVLAALPATTPAPRLRWTLEVADWFVMGVEYVEARAPRRPWDDADLDRCLAALADAGESLGPGTAWPQGVSLERAEVELADWPALWDRVARVDAADRVAEAAGLAARQAEVTNGEALVHGDVRDDQLLLAADGRVLPCDWTWPMRGAAWLDPLLLLIGPAGDGVDVEAVISRTPLLAAVPAEHVDIVLALVAGYFLERATLPVPGTSPHLRAFQSWQGEVCWAWLGARRGWSR